jgi:acetolactate synthase-1/2/3 large subunit
MSNFMAVACGPRDEAYNKLVAKVKAGLTGEFTMQPIPEPCFDPAIMEGVDSEWPEPTDPRWFRTTNPAVKNLAQVFDINVCGEKTQCATSMLQSGAFCKFLEDVSGVPNLMPDPHFTGGLLNDIDQGGYISGHLDFNFSGTLKLYRRMNVLVYLNKDWTDKDEGRLQFWDKDGFRRASEVSPDFNTAAIFMVHDQNFHGLPQPVGKRRRTLNLYYYSQERSLLQSVNAHLTLWPKYLNGGLTPDVYRKVPLREEWDGVSATPLDGEADGALYRSLVPQRTKRLAVKRDGAFNSVGPETEDVTDQECAGSKWIASFIKRQGVDVVFGMTGGYIHHSIDAVCETPGMRFITVHNEQGAALAADAYARVSGKMGVCMAISGPGGINFLQGTAQSYYDSYPVLNITGQVNLAEMVNGRPGIRQHGFQECDIISIAKPICKYAKLVKDHDELESTLITAATEAQTGRKGPVWVDIPLNFQATTRPHSAPTLVKPVVPGLSDEARVTIGEMLQTVAKAEKPLLLLGGGINSAGLRGPCRDFVNLVGAPCVSSLLACDVLPHSHPLRVGMIGTYGIRSCNELVMESDVLVVLGSRLDLRQTGTNTESFANRRIFHVDVAEGEINFRIKGVTPVVADLNAFFPEALQQAQELGIKCGCDEWLSIVRERVEKSPITKELEDMGSDKIRPTVFVQALSRRSKPYKANFASGCGNVQMWAAQSIECEDEQRLLMPGGHSPMGSGLPMAIGACFASDSPCVVVEGDGGLQMNIQELQTVVRNHLPIKIVVMNNGCLGMLRQFCKSWFNDRLHQSVWGYDTPDFASVAKAYGLGYGDVTKPWDIDAALDKMWADPNEPYLLNVQIPAGAYCVPNVSYGRRLDEMQPPAPGAPIILAKKFVVENKKA